MKANTRCCGCWTPWRVIEPWEIGAESDVSGPGGGCAINPEIYTEKTTSAAAAGFRRDAVGLLFRAHPDSAVSGHPRVLLGRSVRSAITGKGYFDQYRGKPAHDVVREVKALKETNITRSIFSVRR